MTDDVLQDALVEAPWFVDGYRLFARSELHARSVAKAMYNIDAVEVRLWADDVDVETGDLSAMMWALDYKERGEWIPFENVEAVYFAFGTLGLNPKIDEMSKKLYEHYGCITGDESHPCIGSHD